MRSIATRFLLPFGFFAVLISVFVFYRTYDSSRKHASELISQQAAMALEFNLAIREYAARKIRPEVEKLVDRDVFIPEVMSTSFISRSIFEEFRHKFPDFVVRFSSDNPRNPNNVATPDEKRMIEYFRQNPDIERRTEEIEIDGKRYLAHFTAKRMKAECMQCHDDPKNAPAQLVQQYGPTASFYRVVGDVAGLDTVAAPMEAISTPLATEMRSQSIILATGLVLLFGAIIFVFNQVVSRRLVNMATHFNDLASHVDRPSMVPVQVEGNDEISIVGIAFNNLVEQLRAIRASLEERVRTRTEELRSVNEQLQSELSERKLAEEALRKSEETFRRIAENMHDLVCEVDAHGVYRYVSPSFKRVLGYEPGELLGESMFTRVHPDDRRHAEAQYGEFIRTREDCEVEFRYRHADGHYVWGVSGASILLNGAGEFSGSLINSRDVTKRKHAEDLLRQSEEKFSQIFQTTPIAIAISQPESGTFIDVNPGFVASTGYSREEAVGATHADLYLWPVPAEYTQLLKHIDSHHEVFNRELKFRRKDGVICSGMCSARSIVIDGNRRVLLVMQDITDHKRAEEEKEQLRSQLIQAQRMEAIGRLAGGVAHDFNNMLSVIIGRSEMALQQIEASDPLHRELQEIKEAGERSADLTRQLLAFARKQTVSPKVLDLNQTIIGMLRMLQRLIGEDIDLTWGPGDSLWKVRLDPSQINQILANLIVNARDAISGIGNITIKTENVVIEQTIWAEHPEFVLGDYVLMTIRDTGSGMAAEVLDRLFEPFFTTKEVGRGTGLGLATVYGIVKQNNGFIYVRSALGKGTVFEIYIPRFEAETASGPVKESPKRHDVSCITVLLVEDDEAVLKLGNLILESEGYTVLAARTPKEAIKLSGLHSEEIQLLVTDVVMPEMNGRELVEQLRTMRQGMKYLYMSGYTADVITHRGILDEGINFIPKPFTKDDFLRKVRMVLDSKDQGQILQR